MNHIGKIIFIHSDIIRGLRIAHKTGNKINRNNICQSLINYLSKLSIQGKEGLIFPAFNYDYSKTGLYKPNEDVIQVGTLPEWVRNNSNFIRSDVPIYSVISSPQANFICNQHKNPFGKGSIFDWLVLQDASIVFFGANFSSVTFIHYVEEMSGPPIYRYDKVFYGHIIKDSFRKNCVLKMHVRPIGANMNYDWPRIENDLLTDKILQVSKHSKFLKIVNSQKLFNYWSNKLAQDPFYFLSVSSRKYFKKITKNGTARVQLKDFERIKKYN